jgi:hypothetical protein
MSTITYTTAAGDPALDKAFERALEDARAARPTLGQLIAGEERRGGPVFERADPCDPRRIVLARTMYAPNRPPTIRASGLGSVAATTSRGSARARSRGHRSPRSSPRQQAALGLPSRLELSLARSHDARTGSALPSGPTSGSRNGSRT